MQFKSTPAPTRSPWGAVQHSDEIAPGIWQVSTAGHGGFKLSAERNRLMPDYMRTKGGWYEEDCEAALVVLVFPEPFKTRGCWHELAIKSARNNYPDEYQLFTGEVLTPDQSWKLRDREFKVRTYLRFVVSSAWGSWARFVPEGSVGVCALRACDGVERWYLVPADEYAARSGPGFVIDEKRYLEIAEPAPQERLGKDDFVRRTA